MSVATVTPEMLVVVDSVYWNDPSPQKSHMDWLLMEPLSKLLRGNAFQSCARQH